MGGVRRGVRRGVSRRGSWPAPTLACYSLESADRGEFVERERSWRGPERPGEGAGEA